jgi:HAD superfamily hydrolase (TIGR01509 family)
LQQLRTQVPLCLLSNINEVHYEHLQGQYNFTRHFAEVVLSCRVGMVKPEPGIYLEALRRVGVPAEHCIFIDDLEGNVRAAREVGMHGIIFVGIEDLKTRLSACGLTV